MPLKPLNPAVSASTPPLLEPQKRSSPGGMLNYEQSMEYFRCKLQEAIAKGESADEIRAAMERLRKKHLRRMVQERGPMITYEGRKGEGSSSRRPERYLNKPANDGLSSSSPSLSAKRKIEIEDRRRRSESYTGRTFGITSPLSSSPSRSSSCTAMLEQVSLQLNGNGSADSRRKGFCSLPSSPRVSPPSSPLVSPIQSPPKSSSPRQSPLSPHKSIKRDLSGFVVVSQDGDGSNPDGQLVRRMSISERKMAAIRDGLFSPPPSPRGSFDCARHKTPGSSEINWEEFLQDPKKKEWEDFLETIGQYKNATSIILSRRSWGQEGFQRVLRAINENCVALVELELRDCTIAELDLSDWDVENLYQLNKLTLTGCKELSTVNGCDHLSRLQLSNCESLERLFLQKCELLELELNDCNNLTDLVVESEELTELTVKECPSLIKVILKCAILQNLVFGGCFAVKELMLQNCPLITDEVLRKMMDQCSELCQLTLKQCDGLKHLDFSGSQLQRVGIQLCTPLQSVNFSDSKKLKKVTLNCENCHALTFSDCPSLRELDVNQCPALKRLNCLGCSNLCQVQLTKCQELEFVDFSECASIDTLDLAGKKQLKGLALSGCVSLYDLQLSQCRQLTEVEFFDCHQLATLGLRNCTKFPHAVLNAILESNAIQQLDLTNWRGLKKIDFTTCSHLSWLSLYGCHTELPNLGQCCLLKRLDIRGCPVQDRFLREVQTASPNVCIMMDN